jgi:hypothetical protein
MHADSGMTIAQSINGRCPQAPSPAHSVCPICRWNALEPSAALLSRCMGVCQLPVGHALYDLTHMLSLHPQQAHHLHPSHERVLSCTVGAARSSWVLDSSEWCNHENPCTHAPLAQSAGALFASSRAAQRRPLRCPGLCTLPACSACFNLRRPLLEGMLAPASGGELAAQGSRAGPLRCGGFR